ncbi:gliding motility lipoprotein GldB [uncultured Phocaeicola sp.]|uniref:gliding motility protein GldB-related protein n=1 Tax=uncultured Phocaeicola sp. TaxID=990718 RepID=UPI0025F0D02A|nr:gliding motility lipoprotein GldB [uncultured Phocaeicola sp.]
MKQIIFILLGVIVFASCRSEMQSDDALFDRGIKVFRYDRLQYEATAMNSIAAVQKMNLDCPRATRILIEDVLMLGKVDEPNINERMCAYYTDSVLFRLMLDAEEKFGDMRPIEEKLTEGFRELKKEVPSLPIPLVYSQISALNQSVVVGDSLLGFSLDKYMGEDYPLYKRYYYAYQRRSMKPERILPDCFTFYLMSQYPFGWEKGRRTLFDVIMHQGKINWVVRKVLGIKSNAELLDYTKAEADWCKKNEKKLWKWMVSREYLSSTDPMIIRAYTHPDPNIILKGESVPPIIGIWIGMQLTEKFMKQHPDMSIETLLECEDFGNLTLE